jgi:hypothetical protein
VYRTFETNAIDPDAHVRIHEALKVAVTAQDVRDAFKQPQTPLGARLLAIRQQRVADGGPLLDEDALAAEVKARRGDDDGVDGLIAEHLAGALDWATGGDER